MAARSQKLLSPPTSPNLNESRFMSTTSPTHLHFHEEPSVRFDENNETFIKDEYLKGFLSNLNTTSESILKMLWENKTTSLQQSTTSNTSITQLTDQVKGLKSLLTKFGSETSLSTKGLTTMTQSIVGIDDRVSEMLKTMEARLLHNLQEKIDHKIKVSEILIDRKLQEHLDHVKGLLSSYGSHLDSLKSEIHDFTTQIKDVEQEDVRRKTSDISELQIQVAQIVLEMRELIHQLSVQSLAERRLNDDRLREERIQFHESVVLERNTVISLFKTTTDRIIATLDNQRSVDTSTRDENTDPKPVISKRPATPRVIIKSTAMFTPERIPLQPMTSICNTSVRDEPSQKSNSRSQNVTICRPAPPSISRFRTESKSIAAKPSVPTSTTNSSQSYPNMLTPRICSKPPTIKLNTTPKTSASG
jgi:hypothetical protein